MALQVWLPLNGNLNNQGLTNVTITNYGATVDNNGKIGKCYTLDGTDDRIQLSNLPNPTNISVAFWMKRNATTNSRQFMFTAWGGVTCEMTETNLIHCYTNGGGGACDSTFAVTADTGWIHVVYTFEDKVGGKLYLNGVLNKTAASTTSINWTTTIGNIGNYSNMYFNGKMNDFRFYDHVLSPKEIEILSRGLVCHYPLSDSAVEATTNLVTSISAGGQTTINGDMVTTSGENKDTYFFLNTSETIINGQTYTLSCDVSGIASGEHWRFSFYGDPAIDLYNGHNEITFTAKKDTSGTQLILDDTYRPIINNPTTFSHFQLEKKDHATLYAGLGRTRSGDTTVYDTSGYQNNGAIIGSFTVSNDSARYSYSTLFTNGTANYTNTSLVMGENKSFTMNLWMKSTDGSAGYGGYHILASIESSQYEMSMGNGGRPRIGFNISGTRYVADYGDINCLDKKWHMITMTYDGNNIKAYVDGEIVGTTARSGTLATGTKSFRLGNYMGTTYGDKNILKSDVRIYATALSDTQIAELYNTAVSVSNNGALLGYELVEV